MDEKQKPETAHDKAVKAIAGQVFKAQERQSGLLVWRSANSIRKIPKAIEDWILKKSIWVLV
jgi:hypothetical protein